jgi:hypothetical protein
MSEEHSEIGKNGDGCVETDMDLAGAIRMIEG